MHYLRLALVAEGPSDHRFLPVILRRLAVDLCAHHGQRSIETVDEVLEISALPGTDDPASRLAQAVLAAADSFDVLFLHRDGGGDPAAARTPHIFSMVERIRSGLGENRWAAVVPVREMEAWALVDGEALRRAFGTSLDEDALGVPPRPYQVEEILDPKQVLDQAYRAVTGPRRRGRKYRAVNFLNVIGERVRLDLLRQVPAFQELERDLNQVLENLGYFR